MAPVAVRRGTESAPKGRFARVIAGRAWIALPVILALVISGIAALRQGPGSDSSPASGHSPGPSLSADYRPDTEPALPAPPADPDSAKIADARRNNELADGAPPGAARQEPFVPGSDSPESSQAGGVPASADAGNEPAAAEESGQEGGDAGPDLSISGAVVDDRGNLLSGIPVTARLVAIAPPGEPSADGAATDSRVSDAYGMFTFEGLEEGEYDLTADGGEAYRPAQARVRAGVASAELRLQRLRSVLVHGLVTTPGDMPLEAVRVRALGDQATVVTDRAGAYELPVDLTKAGQPPVLEFTREQYRERVERVESVLGSDADSVRLDVRMEPSEVDVLLSGRVAGPKGEAVPGARVWLSSPDPRDFQRTMTSEGGEYVFSEVETGDAYRVGVEDAEGYRPYVSEPLAVGPHDTLYDILLEDAGEGWLTGEVVDPEGSPLANFSLWLRTESGGGASLPVQTDGGGRFEVAEVPSGQLKLETRSQPYLHATGISLLASETRHVVVPLDWGQYWLFGQVIDSSGSPVAAARVVLQWHRQYPDVFSVSRREASSDRLGYFTFANLGAGEHVLTVSAPGFETARLIKDPRLESGEFPITLRASGPAGAGAGH